ncbi:MAG: flagellar motor protein MotB [Hyphomicrobiales bacterium]|nr:MAG: flagellar motor protein MotB [Hyphomicrobiales bacterium]
MSNGPPIIIKKKVEGEEDHHGGVWKLAFADFMTAMMAFFLVMWLINSTSKETKAVIVQYFNPVQLVDTTKAHKGLRDPATGSEGKSAINPPVPKKGGASESKDTEAALQSEPLKTLDAIAREEPRAGEPPASEVLRDPFERTLKKEMRPPPESAAEPPPAHDKAGLKQGPTAAGEKAAMASDLQAEIEKIAAQEARAPKVEVRQTEEGLLISLTDDANFSMFDVGSIKPKPQLVRIIGEVGKILAGKPGAVELRGHTDGRSYSGKNYDNWRLSSDRATIVNYMLIRGGLPATRMERVVGFADRRPRNAKDPLSPVNRRIEILLRGVEP